MQIRDPGWISSLPSCDTTTKELKTEGIDFYWRMKCPVIGSIIVVKQLIMALGGGILFVFILLLVMNISAAIGAAPVLFGIFIFLLVLAFIIAGALQVITKGGLYMEKVRNLYFYPGYPGRILV